ncbi:unnamed protein product [Jaminaea pallidilutea]
MTRSSTLSPRVNVDQQEVLPLSVDTAASTSLLAPYSDPMSTSSKTNSMFSSKPGADTTAKSALFPFEAPPRKGSYAASADILAARPRANGAKKKKSSIGGAVNDRFRRDDIINSTNGFDRQTMQDSQKLGLSRSTSSEAANRTMTQADGQSGHTRAIAALHDPATFIDEVVALSSSTARLPLLLLRRPSGAEVDYAATLASAASRLTFALKARKGKGVAGSQPSPQVSLAGADLLSHVERLATCSMVNGSGSGDDFECLRESIKFMLVLCEAQGAVARALKSTTNKAAPELAFSAHEEAASQNNSEASSIPHFLKVPESKHSSLASPSSGIGTMSSPDMPRRSLVQSGLDATGMSPPNLSRLDVPDSSTTTTSNWSLDSSSSPVSKTLHTDPSIALAQARRIISRLLEDRVMMQQEVDDLNAAVFLEASDLLHAERIRNAELEAEVERLKLEQGAQSMGSSDVLDDLHKDGPASSSASATSPTHTVFSSSSKVPSSSGSLLDIQQPVAALDIPGCFETAGKSPAEVVARAPSPAAASSQAASPPNARAGSLSSTDDLLLVECSSDREVSSRPADDSDGSSAHLASQSEDRASKAKRSSSIKEEEEEDDDDHDDDDDDDDDDEDVFADTFDHLNAFPPAPPREVPFDLQTTPASGTPEADNENQSWSRRGSVQQHNRRWSTAGSSICSSGRRASLPPRPPEPNSPLPELPAGAIPSPTSSQFEYQLRPSSSTLPAIGAIVEQHVPGAAHVEQLQDGDAVPDSGASTDPHADWLSSVLKHGKPLIPQRMQSSTWPSPPTTDDERPSFQTQSSRGSDTLRAPSPLPPYHPALPGRDASLTNDLSPPKNGVDSRRRAPSHASTASTRRSSTLTTSSVPTSVSSGAMLHSKSSHNGNNGLRLRPHQSPTQPSSSSSSSREPRDLAALGVGNPPVASKNKPSKGSRSRILANIDRSSSWSNEGSSSQRSDLAFAVPEPVPAGHLQSHLVVRRQSAPRRMSSFTSGAAPILPTRSSSASVPPYSEMMEEGEEAAALRKETADSNGGYGRVGAMADNERARSSARAEEETSSENQWGTRRWRYAGA